jgi:iron complex outermembrane receptor protein
MRGKDLLAVLLGSCLLTLIPANASAQRGGTIRIDSKDQSLAAALLDVAAQAGIALILATPSARTLAAPKLHGRYTLDEAIAVLLARSGLTWRRSHDGTYFVTPLARAPAEGETVAMPEILVTGRRTQNSDIRRSESDIQPYKVWTSEDVAQSHSVDIDDFLRNCVTSNAQIASAAQLANGGNASEVNLRGLGSGRRWCWSMAGAYRARRRSISPCPSPTSTAYRSARSIASRC